MPARPPARPRRSELKSDLAKVSRELSAGRYTLARAKEGQAALIELFGEYRKTRYIDEDGVPCEDKARPSPPSNVTREYPHLRLPAS